MSETDLHLCLQCLQLRKLQLSLSYGDMKDIKSARLLLKAAKDLEASLLKEYEVQPDDPGTDFLNAAANVAVFSKIVFRDLVERQGSDICASWALRASIALGEFEEAARFLDMEIVDMKSESLDLRQLRETTESAMRNHGRSARWKQLLLRIDQAI